VKGCRPSGYPDWADRGGSRRIAPRERELVSRWSERPWERLRATGGIPGRPFPSFPRAAFESDRAAARVIFAILSIP